MKNIYLSIVIPVYNEQGNLYSLYDRLVPAMDALNQSYEIIFVNDGSSDNSLKILTQLQAKLPEKIRVIDFNGNFGQHMAIMAGFSIVRGSVIVTLDADLQDPPEEIHKLLTAYDQGHDYVGSIRENRQDNWFRRYASKLNNKIRFALTGIKMTDQGCMLRAYSRRIVDLMVQSQESSAYIPALAYSFASSPIEITVAHSSRESGTSKYNLFRLLRLNFDIMTGFSLLPLQIFTMLGMTVSLFSGILVLVLILRRFIVGPEVGGVFTLFAIMYFLIGIVLMGLGILGEYIGRIYQDSRKRPSYVIRQIIENE